MNKIMNDLEDDPNMEEIPFMNEINEISNIEHMSESNSVDLKRGHVGSRSSSPVTKDKRSNCDTDLWITAIYE